MAITIKGIKITRLTVEKGSDGEEVSAAYQLISSTDNVLASQSLNSKKGYGDTPFVPSAPVAKALREAVDAYRKEVEMTLGLCEA